MLSRPIVLSLSLTLFPFAVHAADEAALAGEARSVIKGFAGELMGEVKAAMQSGGPVHTIEVCSVKAPQLAQEASDKSGWHVARTSLKVRNPSNTPDEWELGVLEKFEQRKAAGEAVDSLDYGEIISTAEGETYRYMKAIPTGAVCLNCHAAEIKPPVEQKLGELYPNDKARGYSVGDIRGAFTLSKPL